MKSIYKKLILIFGFLIVAGLGISWYLDHWLNKRLPELITQDNDSPYALTYADIDISLFKRSAVVTNAIIVPKGSLQDSSYTLGVFARIPRLEVAGIGVLNLIFSKRISANSIQVVRPDITLYKGQKQILKKKRNFKDEVAEPFSKLITTSKVNIVEGQARVVDLRSKNNAIWLDRFNLEVDNIVVDSMSLKEKIPFRFKHYRFDCHRFYYKTKGFYHLAATNLFLDNERFQAQEFALVCNASRAVFDAHLRTEKDLYNVSAKEIAMDGLQWNLDAKEGLSVRIDSIVITALKANIYRNKTIADDLKKKKLYSQLLRELDFILEVDKIQIKNSLVEYEEKISDRGPGKLSFAQFNLTARNVYSTKGHDQLKNVEIHLDSRFMGVAPLKVHWTFHPKTSDDFRIKGTIDRFPVERLHSFMKPYLNFEGSGMLERVTFDYRGNDDGANGNFAIQFDDLQLKAFQQNNPNKKSKLKTWIANMVVKKDSDQTLKKAQVTAEREKHKSFFNLFWKCMQEGLKQTLLVV